VCWTFWGPKVAELIAYHTIFFLLFLSDSVTSSTYLINYIKLLVTEWCENRTTKMMIRADWFSRCKGKIIHCSWRSSHPLSLVQVLFWEEGSQQSDADRVRVINKTALLSGLKGSTVYVISVRAQNSAGLGPSSSSLNIATKKPRESANSTQDGVCLLKQPFSDWFKCNIYRICQTLHMLDV